MNLPENWNLPEQVRVRVGQNSSGRQRAIVECEHLLLILHKVPDQNSSERESIFYWRRPNGNWRCSVDGNPIAQLKSHLRRYVQVEERLAARYESATRAEDYFRILEEAVPHQRAARNMWLALQAAREAIPDDRDLIELRNVAGDIDRTMELLLKDTQNAVDFDIARTAEEQAQFSKQAAQAGHKLNVLASLFFPLTAVAGVLGMNLPTGLETSPIWVSWGVIGAAVLTGFLLLSWINGRDGT